MNIRVNKDIKLEFIKLCKSKGFSASKVITMFAIDYIKSGYKPFALGEITNADDNLIGMCISMDDELKQQLSIACDKYDNVNPSIIVRSMMHYCVQNDCLPF